MFDTFAEPVEKTANALDYPQGMFDHPFVREAEEAALLMLYGSRRASIDDYWNAKQRNPDITVVEFYASDKKCTEGNALEKFVMPGHAPVIMASILEISPKFQSLTQNLPLLVVNLTDFGVVTAITPVVMLEKTGAVEALREEYGCLKAHIIVVSPREFLKEFKRMKDTGGILRNDTLHIKTVTPADAWNAFKEMGCVEGDYPGDVQLAIRALQKKASSITDAYKRMAICAVYHTHPLVTFKTLALADENWGISITLQKDHRMTPISMTGNRAITIAMSSPPSADDKSALSGVGDGFTFCFVLATPDLVENTIIEKEAKKISAGEIANRISLDTGIGDDKPIEEIVVETLSSMDPDSNDASATIVQFVNSILYEAIRSRATDISVANQQSEMQLRYHIDGMLHDHPTRLPPNLTKPFIARIKILAGIDTQATQMPKDGSFPLKVNAQEFDVRVNITPTVLGESATLRLLEGFKTPPRLEDLGFKAREKDIVMKSFLGDHGLLLVCGPTGSGKSTTLMSTIALVDPREYKICSAEQPVERRIPGIIQVEVVDQAENPHGMSFADALRAFLRSAPKKIIVGEVRDTITAQMSVSAALTGHAVATTLHTNTAAGALARMINLGAEPFLVKEAVKGVIAQRLVPLLCQCAVAYEPSREVLEDLQIDEAWFGGHSNFKKALGCVKCRDKGYYGRTVVVEGFKMTSDIQRLITKNTEHLTQQVKEAMLNQEIEVGEGNEKVKIKGKTIYMQACELVGRGRVDFLQLATLKTNTDD